MTGRLEQDDASVPEAPPSTDPTRPPRPALGGLVAGIGGAALVAAVLLAIVLMQPPSQNVGDATPTYSPSPSPSSSSAPPAPTASPAEPSPIPVASASPTPAAGGARTDLDWTQTAVFPVAGGLSTVDQVVQLGETYVAVGVEFTQEFPNFGPTPPHEARAWTSVDGRSWEPVELGPASENIRFRWLVTRGDGSLLALGDRGIPDEFGSINDTEPVAWTSIDGVTWTELDSPFAGYVQQVEQGPQGTLAIVRPSLSDNVHEFWLSSDGESWELNHSTEANYIDIGAGDEGFAAVGWIGEEDGSPLTMASADGSAWFDGEPPAFSPFLEVAGHGPDWVVVDDPGGTAPTWFSANGLDWAAHGEIPFDTIELEDEYSCREYRAQLHTAGPWLVTASDLAYPCSEGGFMVHGKQYLSVDGAAWVAIPLAEGTAGQNRSGSRVTDALAVPGGLIMAGEENGAATFWFGEAP